MEGREGGKERGLPSPGRGCTSPSLPRVPITAHHNEKGPFLPPAQLLKK